MSILFPERSDFELFDDRRHSFTDVFAKEDQKKSLEFVDNDNSSGNDVKLASDAIQDSETFCHAENSTAIENNDADKIPHINDVSADSAEEKIQIDVTKDVNRYDTITVDNDGNIICVDNEENDTNHEEISVENHVVFNAKDSKNFCNIRNCVESDNVIENDVENVENDVVGNYRDIFRALFLLLSKAHDTWRSDGFSLQFRGWTQPE